MRLSTSILAGTARTLVAVGTVSDAFMFFTTLAAAPRSTVCLGPVSASADAAFAAGRASAAGRAFVAGWGFGAEGAAGRWSAALSAGLGDHRGGGLGLHRGGPGGRQRGRRPGCRWCWAGWRRPRRRRGPAWLRARRPCSGPACSVGVPRPACSRPARCAARRPGRRGRSRRRSRARPGRRCRGRRGTAGTSPRPATRWFRIRRPRRRRWGRAGMSSRLTRGRVPSSSDGRRWTGCRCYRPGERSAGTR